MKIIFLKENYFGFKFEYQKKMEKDLMRKLRKE